MAKPEEDSPPTPPSSKAITSSLMSLAIGENPPNKLRLSCFHNLGALGEASVRAELGQPMEMYILDCYEEALSRLPIADMPELLFCVDRGGHCIGLLDPVSNIIINAINLLCRRKFGRMCSNNKGKTQVSSSSSSKGKEEKAPPTGPSWFIAFSSYKGLIAFLQTYFRYLSQGQAMRYLHLARADLGVAVQLGEHQQFAPENWHTTSRPDLCCGRTQFALKVAAAVAGHPLPDDLARLAKSVIPFKDHKALAAVLHKGRALSVDDINGIIKSFQLQHYAASPPVQVNFHRRPHLTDMEIRGLLGSQQEKGQQPAHFSCVFGENHIADIVVSRYDGPVSSICDLRTPCEMKQMLFNCLDLASTTINKYSSSTHVKRDLITASPSNACQCEHTTYLKMNLADSIHALYVKAVSLLPNKALQKHLRGILVAGHCYGPMDPVSNIILNAIWYDSVYPLLEMDVEIEPDILDSQSMLRMEARSLDSLVAMVRTATGLSEHNALEYLCYKQCDLSVVLQVTTKEICYQAYDRAGQAGKHPKHLELASFLKSMTCDALQELRSLLTNEETQKGYIISDAALQQVYKILEVKNSSISPSADNPRLCPTAWKMLGCRKDDFVQKQKFLRQALEELLYDYSNKHPWEPVPKLAVICGVKKNNRGHSKSYHINFLAYYNDDPAVRVLFFAEVWESNFQPKRSESKTFVNGYQMKPNVQVVRKSSQKESKTSFCCPLPYYSTDHPYLGRCSLCELVLSKIVHPPSGNYTGADCSDLGESLDYLNLRDKVAPAADSITESDFIYYDCLRDAKFAQVLNESRLSEGKKTTIRWS